jgi:Acetyltransferase (GNAT) domain
MTLDSVKELSLGEVDLLCLPLRRKVLQQELRWAPNTASRDAFRDAFDRVSIHFGFFTEMVLVGALRLTVGNTVDELPSGRYISTHHPLEGRVAELSKGVIEKRFRGGPIWPRLISAGIARATLEKATSIFASVLDSPSARRLYSRYGLLPVGRPFTFNDGVIAPPSLAIILQKTI